ncbi:MAG: S8 family serine peptidase [candidate division WOR-3 bacterium]
MHYLLILFFLLPQVPGKITSDLKDVMDRARPDEKIFVIVHMNTEYPFSENDNLTPQEKCNQAKVIAFNSQSALVDYLKSLPESKAEIVRQFWVFNGLHLKATKDVIKELAKRNDIWFISSNVKMKCSFEPQTIEESNVRLDNSDIDNVDIGWNLRRIQADSCWAAGYSGRDVIIGVVGSGVMVQHPALAGKWLAPYWYDAVNGQSVPYDDYWGTFLTGIICGGDGPGPSGNDIGIAYNAKFIPTKCIDTSGSYTYSSTDECLQYMADLKQMGIDIRLLDIEFAYVGTQNNIHWWNIVSFMKDLGILSVCDVGIPTISGTFSAPASYPIVIGVGYVDSLNIANQNVGPSPNIPPINDPSFWFYPTWNFLKPDLLAPWGNVYSAWKNGGYKLGNVPPLSHVVGAAALLLERNPNYTPQQLYHLLCFNCDGAYWAGNIPNNKWGWGILNIWRALQNSPSPNQPNLIITKPRVVGDNNGNEKLDPGENAQIVCYLKNNGVFDATNVSAKLRTGDPGIMILDSTANFGNINVGDSVQNTSDRFALYVSPNYLGGDTARFVVFIACAETSWTKVIEFPVGNPVPNDGRYYCYWSTGPYPELRPVFEWFAIDTTQNEHQGISLDPQNEDPKCVHLPFTFKFYGENYNRIMVHDNGFIVMDSVAVPYGLINGIPTPNLPNNFIAALNHGFLWPNYPNHPADVYYYYDQPRHRFIVEWFKMPLYTLPDTHYSFQIVLHDPAYYPTPTGDGDIYCYYRFYHTDSFGQASYQVGIENSTGTSGVYYRVKLVPNFPCGVPPISDSFALRFTTWAPNSLIGIEENQSFIFNPVRPELRLASNIFNKSLKITLYIPDENYNYNRTKNDISLKIYDVAGRVVRKFNHEIKKNGEAFEVIWNGLDNHGRRLPSGVYFVHLNYKGVICVKKAVLIE